MGRCAGLRRSMVWTPGANWEGNAFTLETQALSRLPKR